MFDKQILHAMAGDDRLRQRVYESMDERDVGWFEESLRAFMQGDLKRNDYFSKLTQTALSLARQGSAVFLGRGIDLILPEDHGIRVRLVAGWEACAARYARQSDLTVEEAAAEVRRLEDEIAEFIGNHFGRDHADPTRHDLIINMDRFEPSQAVELILDAMRLRGIARR